MNTNESPNPGKAPDGPEEPPVEVTQAHGLVPASAPDAMPLVESASPAPVAEADLARTGGAGKAGARPLPETLTAARDAAAFVAQLFAEVSAPEQATPIPSVVQVPSSTDETVLGDAENEAPAAVEPAGETVVSALHGQHVLILGLGASGLAMARWCVRQGARVTVADTRETPPQLASLQAELPQVDFRAGAFESGLVEGKDIRAVFKSPGLSPAVFAPVWQAAQAIGLWTGGELDLFARALRELQAERAYAPQVLAITGTNGKTTTTALTGQLVAHGGKTVAVAGNIGPNLLDMLAGHLDAGTLPEVWVLELSSFQLDGVQGFEPTAAAVLNLTQDHLDWHGSMQAYGAAKARIFGSQGLLVLNRDDPAVMAMLPEPVRLKLQKPKWREYVSFGLEAPQRPGDYGIETVNGMAWLVRAAEADETVKRRKDEEVVLYIQRLMPVEALRIRGRHNATNALAALALAGAVGGNMASMLHGLREYTGEPHRVTPVAVVRDVEYFDDSKGTNVGATVAALTGLGAERKLVLIAGGEGKGQDFSPLAGPVRQHARAVVLIGRDAPLIRAALEGTGVPLLDADSMQGAVELAARQAQTGDAVLMSPACASFDMFDNYGHRAQVFCDAVQALAQDAGVVS
ncbi:MULTISPECIES: UDP-N-acetylmuramoyl-L-alanine--D-glutamate ligase [unclassified Polaromonas]|jgi:UDP-N-acetylmuramoylalanine--D-glutamate ligase|uniref:UDP-N-acetylmuramoyl-L-alanine--D-glutamate ligase n=1 Tax=unclassified Polaromonas TaxID=2638319 RepID=UPI000BC5FCD8|nr:MULTISPECIES: UDP-N-acetylmuramoyl-L-alanine--D-glutamate ligase [unclassified Polaromonas]OYY36399.1 MAG: UDP-N-acetylmuramoyl-L-alanine--D-glutamate ligase [Polaromonas sp. 35-63-35]OYZ22634.1 MAG: UDP-N-acetylmuramoyl-L-alanine--D-glutamate ligase [Polaromonas sp. 16-63-31]OYZ81150.1 MAG: UDP-N-acetylmuramoyl-L-alanine--D-glutamate ligase [Polaromonas sp. 24-63-21]OZA52628.1 MAG: UDP-N-acetylmuramoyl-L-alanine--D-glutamate ligase [Polaromonas sp. 17-63-33]OZA88513.1 MAG: UDP-N-acetylmura